MWPQYIALVASIAGNVVSSMLILPLFTRSTKYALSADVQYVVMGGGVLVDIEHPLLWRDRPCEEMGTSGVKSCYDNKRVSCLLCYDNKRVSCLRYFQINHSMTSF